MTQSQLMPFVLDDRGRDYVLSILSQGLTLARMIAGKLERHSAGICVALVPPRSSAEQVYSFRESIGSTAVAGRVAAASAIRKTMKGRSDILLVGESAEVKAYDADAQDWFSTTLTHKSDLYLALSSDQLDDAILDDVLRLTDALWSSNLFMTRINTHSDELKGEIDSLDLSILCEGLQCLLARAYDGESYVFWNLNDSRRRSPQPISNDLLGVLRTS